MGEAASETNWWAIGLAVTCLLGFVASFYITPKRIDAQWILTKALRWELPVGALFFFIFNYYPTEEVIYGGVAIFFTVSVVAAWFAYREAKGLERQCKLAKSDGND